jgi:carbamoyl-phosphate synthase large subunit
MTSKPRCVLILGSGALRIGQAGEFDYSGSQAAKALREEGIRTVLVNPNVATIQTTPGLADEIYLVPVEPDFVERVIERERPDAVLLSFGGQSALNCGVALWRSGALERHGVRVLGTPVAAIEDTEDRELFARRMRRIGVHVARSATATSWADALEAVDAVGLPAMVRAAYSLGGLGSGAVRSVSELDVRVRESLAFTPQVLIEEYLGGWKEVEYEVIRDRHGNAVTVCNMENLDPMGIHTGESIVVAPSQTLTNDEYHRLRTIALTIVHDLGIVGECNVQFALHPVTGDYRVIEVNARLSRSSALASKATGYPLAWVAAKLALGYSLADLKNAVTGVTGCFFEPALDYVTVKLPRWDLDKFPTASRRIGSEMKSVGEVMAIGVSFEEALQKAVRSLGQGMDGLTDPRLRVAGLAEELEGPTDRRLYALVQALGDGATVADLNRQTGIDPWFLERLRELVAADAAIGPRGAAGGGGGADEEPADGAGGLVRVEREALADWKRLGFSDGAIARRLGVGVEAVRKRRLELGIVPTVRRIDTLAGEFPATTNYLYVTYGADRPEVTAEEHGRPVMVLGGGPYRIGSSVEFDWCSVGAVQTAAAAGHQTIMINCNPETVSTDYDIVDRLYFEELTLERILDIVAFERPIGVVVSVGGQVANNLALALDRAGVHILGTPADSIDRAENRHRFSSLLDDLGVAQPPWRELTTLDEAKAFADEVGYPVLVRPSYVLSGSAMNVARTPEWLERFLGEATRVSPESPVVISKFLVGAKEIEVDGVAQDGELVLYCVSEHIEHSGVHSGDATVVLPPQSTYLETLRRAKRATRDIARGLAIHGPFNIQFLARNNELSVIECNLRASRSFPFVSKATGYNFIEIAMRAMLGEDVRGQYNTLDLDHVAVKVPQFSFSRLKGADPVLYVEMTSTGEVACLGDSLEEAYLKAWIATGLALPKRSLLLSVGSDKDKLKLLEGARALVDAGFELYATRGTHTFLAARGVVTRLARKLSEQSRPTVVDLIRDRAVDCVINVPRREDVRTMTDGYHIRRTAADLGVPLVNDGELARLFIRALLRYDRSDLAVRPLAEYVRWQGGRPGGGWPGAGRIGNGAEART